MMNITDTHCTPLWLSSCEES